MYKKYLVLKIISGVVGGFFGLIGGGYMGLIVGVFSGFLVGHYYVYFILKIRVKHVFLKILLGTIYGALSGLISGVSVHLPAMFVDPHHSLFGVGAMFGVVIGGVLGFIGICIIVSLYRVEDNE